MAKMTPWENKNLTLYHVICNCMAQNDLYGQISLVRWKQNTFPPIRIEIITSRSRNRRNFSRKFTKMTSENRKCHLILLYAVLYRPKWLTKSYKFNYMEMKYFSVNFIRIHNLQEQKMVKFQVKNHQNDPLWKQKCHFFSRYHLLYGPKWLIWFYTFD